MNLKYISLSHRSAIPDSENCSLLLYCVASLLVKQGSTAAAISAHKAANEDLRKKLEHFVSLNCLPFER